MSSLSLDLAAGLDPVRFAAGSGFRAEGWEERLLRDGSARQLVRCARQVGKTTTVAWRVLHTALYVPGRDVLVVSPTQRQSDEFLLRVRSAFRGLRGGERLRRDNASELGFVNGSRVVSLPGSEGVIRGFANVRLLVVDEAARVDDDVFVSCLPMVGSDGVFMALSTPWGRRGWFFDLHEDPRNGWVRHKVSVWESGQYDVARIESLRGSMGSFEWASDYECEFGDTNSQFFSSESISGAVGDFEEWSL